MKKGLIFSTLALVLLFANGAAAQKFGYINSAELLTNMAEIKQADSDLQAFQTQLQKQGEKLVTELQSRAQLLEKQKADGTIAPKAYEDETKVLQAEEAKIGEFEQNMYAQLGAKKETLYKPILDKVNEAIKAVSKEGEFLMIFDATSGVFLYADESQDVTKLVKTKLGLSN